MKIKLILCIFVLILLGSMLPANASNSYIANDQEANFTYNYDGYWAFIKDWTQSYVENTTPGFQYQDYWLGFNAEASSLHIAYIYSSTYGRYIQAMSFRKPWL